MVDPQNLPPFAEDADCPKCRSGSVAVIWHDYCKKKFPCETDFEWILGEHLCRVCNRCRHGWCEAPADVKPPTRRLRAVDP